MLSKEQKSAVRNAAKKSANLIDELLLNERIPKSGWDDGLLCQFLESLASADSNNKDLGVGAGEREGRVVSSFVGRLHFGMSHGVGRSGNIAETQPKALGSSALNSISNSFALRALQLAGLEQSRKAILLPVCTGMALTLSLLTLKQKKPAATHVVWSRIDQKSCFKSIVAAGLIPVVVELEIVQREGGFAFELTSTEDAIERAVSCLKTENILCIMTTTSCFAPRQPDDVVTASNIARKHGLFHLVNNAYGLQSRAITDNLNQALVGGGIDLFVQSTDKNFLTPVGGSIVASSNKQLVTDVGRLYPGRASAVPCRDFVLTMLHLGERGYLDLIDTRHKVNALLLERLEELARELNEVAWQPEGNDVSMAMTLKRLVTREKQKAFGGMLYSKYKVTGARVITSTEEAVCISGLDFVNFSSHTDIQHCGFLVVASGIGMTSDEVHELISRLGAAFREI